MFDFSSPPRVRELAKHGSLLTHDGFRKLRVSSTFRLRARVMERELDRRAVDVQT